MHPVVRVRVAENPVMVVSACVCIRSVVGPGEMDAYTRLEKRCRVPDPTRAALAVCLLREQHIDNHPGQNLACIMWLVSLSLNRSWKA